MTSKAPSEMPSLLMINLVSRIIILIRIREKIRIRARKQHFPSY